MNFTVKITESGFDRELAQIRIIYLSTSLELNVSYYSVEFAFSQRNEQVHLHRRSINWPTDKNFNIITFLKEALNSLDELELDLDEQTNPSDMARRQSNSLPEIQT